MIHNPDSKTWAHGGKCRKVKTLDGVRSFETGTVNAKFEFVDRYRGLNSGGLFFLRDTFSELIYLVKSCNAPEIIIALREHCGSQLVSIYAYKVGQYTTMRLCR